jgi:hypothetical protein
MVDVTIRRYVFIAARAESSDEQRDEDNRQGDHRHGPAACHLVQHADAEGPRARDQVTGALRHRGQVRGVADIGRAGDDETERQADRHALPNTEEGHPRAASIALRSALSRHPAPNIGCLAF